MEISSNLYVVAADGRPPTIQRPTQEAWIGKFTWAPDSRSTLYIPTERTSLSGAQMFEPPVIRAWVGDRRVERVTPGPVVAFSLGISRAGASIAYKEVENRTMGDVVTMDLRTGRTTQVTDINPELNTWPLGTLEPAHWQSFDGKEIRGLLRTPRGYRSDR